MIAVPDAIALTTPVDEFTDALVVAELDHVPPGTELDNVVSVPAHADSVPVITSGDVFVTTAATGLVRLPLVLHNPVPSHVITQ